VRGEEEKGVVGGGGKGREGGRGEERWRMGEGEKGEVHGKEGEREEEREGEVEGEGDIHVLILCIIISSLTLLVALTLVLNFSINNFTTSSCPSCAAWCIGSKPFYIHRNTTSTTVHIPNKVTPDPYSRMQEQRGQCKVKVIVWWLIRTMHALPSIQFPL
jgi:hypothetical protein